MNVLNSLKCMPCGGKLRSKLVAALLVCLAAFPVYEVLGQGSIGIRITPNLSAVPEVFNNSPAAISTGTTTALEAGVDYTYMLKGKWGISLGTEFGTSNWSYNLTAPLAAFNNNGTEEASISRFHNYLYNSASLNAVYKIPTKENDIRIFAGPIFRVHHSQRVGSSRRRDNNNKNNYQYANDPAAGSVAPDFLLVYPNNVRLLTIMSAGVGYEHRVSEKLKVLLGLRANLGLQTMTKGIIDIHMNNQLYKGSINTNSNYLGFDVALRFSSFSKRTE